METDTNTQGNSTVLLGAYDGQGNLLTGWTVGGTVISDPGDHYAPQLVTSEDMGVIVTWYGWDSTSNYSQVYMQKYSLKGVALWNGGKPVQVTTGKYDCQYPMLVSDKRKGAYVTWMRYDTNLSASSPDIFLQHIDSVGHVASGWSASPDSVAVTPSLREYYPHLALTPDLKSVYVVYGSGLVGSTALILKRFNAANGAYYKSWGSAGDTISPGGNVYPDVNHDLWLYADNNNNAVVTWIESRYTANGEVYMQQVDTTGASLMTQYGLIVAGITPTNEGVDYLEEMQESDGNFILTFNNLDIFNDLEALKITPHGVIIWNDTNITVNGKSAYPIAVTDGNKGVFIFYVLTNSPEALHAIALDSNGVLYKTWTLPGPGFGEIDNYDVFEPNYDLNPSATNKGEAIVAWNKINGVLSQMYICDLLSDGTTCSNPTGINELKATGEGVSVYPNPSKGVYTVAIKNYQLKIKNFVEVYNVLGQQVYSNSLVIPNSGFQIDLTAQPTGIYLYRVISENGELIGTGKLIKE
jgi:hypothetical protein